MSNLSTSLSQVHSGVQTERTEQSLEQNQTVLPPIEHSCNESVGFGPNAALLSQLAEVAVDVMNTDTSMPTNKYGTLRSGCTCAVRWDDARILAGSQAAKQRYNAYEKRSGRGYYTCCRYDAYLNWYSHNHKLLSSVPVQGGLNKMEFTTCCNACECMDHLLSIHRSFPVCDRRHCADQH